MARHRGGLRARFWIAVRFGLRPAKRRSASGLCRRGSMAERRFRKAQVVGSIPTVGFLNPFAVKVLRLILAHNMLAGHARPANVTVARPGR